MSRDLGSAAHPAGSRRFCPAHKDASPIKGLGQSQEHQLDISIKLVHDSQESFPDAASFNPDRFIGVPKPAAWIPFGGGVNRCVGAAFATMETDIALRTLLRELRFAPTDAPDERGHWRGVASVPAQGARAVVYQRTAKASRDAESVSVADHGSA